MPVFPQDANETQDGVKTTHQYGNTGAGVSDWFTFMREADGGNAALGSTSDTAKTDATASGTLLGFVKGILTRFGTSAASGVLKAEDVAATNGDLLIPIGVVRADTAAAEGGNGDYVHLLVNNVG